LLRSFTFDRLLLTLFCLAIAVACGLTRMQTDTWWQLRAGMDMWASRRVLLTDTYSHTAFGSPWPNHEWLSEVIFYGLYRLGGFPLLTLTAAALILGGWLISWTRAQGPARWRFTWMLSALLPASLWWEPRPHAFSLLFIPATVWLLARGRWAWLVPVFFVWANCHGGVLLGFVLLGAGLGTQAVLNPGKRWPALLALCGCVLAVTATPLGTSFWTEIPESLARIRLYPLDEWQRPKLLDLRVLPFWLLAVAFCYGLLRKRATLRQTPAEIATVYACAAVLLPMALSAIRSVGPFLMIATPALTALFPSTTRSASASTTRERPMLNLAVAVIAIVAVAFTIAHAYRNRIPRLHWTPVPAGVIAAFPQCPDNIYNRYDEGGSLLWFVPNRRVFMDGRQDPFPPELVLEHIGMETGRLDFREVFARHDIHCAYLPSYSPTAQRLLQAGWQPLYRDADWLLLRD
jgi:hypothetical protein